MAKKYYITTPIYYINDVPHIGHAYTSIAADVLARYHKNLGEEVFFLSGSDEHGAKIAEAAKKAGKTPKEFTDELVPIYQSAWKKLGVEYTDFIRTSDPRHEKMVQDFVQRLIDNGFVEKRKYEGLYCIGCERFLNESELVEGKCPDHQTVPAKQSEENHFFLLSKFRDQLVDLIEKNEFVVAPESRRNEILGKLKLGLDDISISRANVEWGIPFPGDESQTIYVWIDALLNYYTAAKIFDKESFWPAQVHLMAKDIVWFHAIIWPAILLAAGEEKLPKKVFAHGYMTVGGQKMSKSIGNVLDPHFLVEKYGSDAVRYAVLREFPFGEDGDISDEKIGARYLELANNIGNLLQRTISMITRYEIPKEKLDIAPDADKLEKILADKYDNLQFNEALMEIMKFAEEANGYIAKTEPWTLAKEGKTDELTAVLAKGYADLQIIAGVIAPFMPEISKKMTGQLETLAPEVLFPRLES